MYAAYIVLLMLTSALGGHLSAKAYPTRQYGSVVPMLAAVIVFLVLFNGTLYLARNQ